MVVKLVDCPVWIDSEKVKKLDLDGEEWFEITKILDDSRIPNDEKKIVFDEYVKNLINSIKKEDNPWFS